MRGQIEFGAFDSSMLVNVGWRMASGQLPYRDFPSMLPPAFLLLADAAVRVFHAKWYAFTLTASLFYLGIAFWGWAMVRLARLPQRVAEQLLAAFLISISMPHLVTNHLWHAVIASLFAISFLLFLTVGSIAPEHPRQSRWQRNAYLCLGVLAASGLWMSKPNITLTTFACSMLIPLVRGKAALWRDWLLATGVSLLLALAVVRACGMHPLQIAHSYGMVSERPRPPVLLYAFFGRGLLPSMHIDAALVYAFVFFVSLLLLLLLVLCRRSPAVRTLAPVALCGFLITLAGLLTNLDFRSNDLGPLSFAAMLVLGPLLACHTETQRALRTAIGVLCIQACLLCLFHSLHRSRMIGVGAWAGLPFGGLPPAQHDTFFGRFRAREAFWKDLAWIDADVKRHEHERIFFGPRLEFENARYGVVPAAGLPIWWHRGTGYPAAVEQDLVRVWRAQDYQTVYTIDLDRFPADIVQTLQTDYTTETISPSPLIVFRKKSRP